MSSRIYIYKNRRLIHESYIYTTWAHNLFKRDEVNSHNFGLLPSRGVSGVVYVMHKSRLCKNRR